MGQWWALFGNEELENTEMAGRFQTLIKKEMAKLLPKKIERRYKKATCIIFHIIKSKTHPIMNIVCLLGLNAKWWLHSSQYLEKKTMF